MFNRRWSSLCSSSFLLSKFSFWFLSTMPHHQSLLKLLTQVSTGLYLTFPSVIIRSVSLQAKLLHFQWTAEFCTSHCLDYWNSLVYTAAEINVFIIRCSCMLNDAYGQWSGLNRSTQSVAILCASRWLQVNGNMSRIAHKLISKGLPSWVSNSLLALILFCRSQFIDTIKQAESWPASYFYAHIVKLS